MAKDPAFLFYSSDFLNGVADLTMEERGQYITLLCLQHQKGAISDKTIRLSVGSVSVDVLAKFKKDEAGNFFNERLVLEMEKRSNFTESRRNNGVKGGRPPKKDKTIRLSVGKPKQNHMENENENENNNENKKGNEKKAHPEFKNCMGAYSDFVKLQTGAPPKISPSDGKAIKEIIDYLEKFPNAQNGTKSVFELFQYVLQNFNKWDKFHKNQIKLPQIASNLINIVNTLKNGQSLNGTTEQKFGRFSAADSAEFLGRGAIAPLD